MSVMAARKRNPIELERDRARVLEMKLRGYTYEEIRQALYNDFGTEVSLDQVKYDAKQIKAQMQEIHAKEMKTVLATEIERMNVLEREAWTQYRAAITIGVKRGETIEYSKDSDEPVRRYERSDDDPSQAQFWFRQIRSIQMDRRKLLGMYVLRVDVNKRSEINTKHYVSFNPATDWPQLDSGPVVEGQIIDEEE